MEEKIKTDSYLAYRIWWILSMIVYLASNLLGCVSVFFPIATIISMLLLILKKDGSIVLIFILPALCTPYQWFFSGWGVLSLPAVLICFVFSICSVLPCKKSDKKVNCKKHLYAVRGLLLVSALLSLLASKYSISVFDNELNQSWMHGVTYAGLKFLPLFSLFISFMNPRIMCCSIFLYSPLKILYMYLFEFYIPYENKLCGKFFPFWTNPEPLAVLFYGMEYLSGVIFIAVCILSVRLLLKEKKSTACIHDAVS